MEIKNVIFNFFNFSNVPTIRMLRSHALQTRTIYARENLPASAHSE